MADFKGDYDHTFKLVLVGDSGVGKTSLLAQFTKGLPPQEHQPPTIGLEFACKTIRLGNGVQAKAQIWDTAGQEKYRAITTAHYRRAAGVLIVYDITKSQSFENVQKWLSSVREVLEREVPILLVGNKTDLEPFREVPEKRAATYSSLSGLLFTEASATDSVSVSLLFSTLAEAIYQSKGPLNTTEGSVVIPHMVLQKRKSECCGYVV